LRSSGIDVVFGCHLLRCSHIIPYFLWMHNEFFIILFNILKIAELDCCQIIILSMLVPSMSSGTDVVCGCHLSRCLYNIHYFLWLDNELLIILCNILKAYCVRFLSNYNIKYTCTIYTRLDTCLMSISRFSLWDKQTLRLLSVHLYGADMVEWCRALDIMQSDWCCRESMVWVQIPSREE
jgi:hypothetical protein